MIPAQELTAEQRVLLRAGFAARMNRTNDLEWRKFWKTEVLFLDSRHDEAVSQLRDLSKAENLEVAVAALMSLGDWYEQSGSSALAQQAYTEAIETERGATSAVLARTKLARLHNEAHEPALAAAALEGAVAVIEEVPADAVQFVVTEYCQALRDLGHVHDARMFIRRAINCFPDRTELPLLEQHLLGASES